MGNISAEKNPVTCPESHDYQTFVPSPVDCTKFYMCVHSEPVEMSCPHGLWFDSESNVCEYPENAKCGAECQDPWVRPGSSVACYLPSQGSGIKFDDAVEYCESHNGFLAEPRSDFETASIESIVTPNINYWIGLSDREEEGSFRWISDKSEPNYSNWQKNEPNNQGGNQHCGQLWARHGHRWDDQGCGKTQTTMKTAGKKYPILALCQK
jgi:hypothetical protein